MSEQIKQHYQSLYDKHGRDHNAVQYSSATSQHRRFDILLDIATPIYCGEDASIASIADIGCGLGDILPDIRHRFGNIDYHGFDFVDGFLRDASARFENDKHAHFHPLDITQQEIPVACDLVVLSGMLNNAMPNDSSLSNSDFTRLTLTKMFSACQKGIAFNGLSTYVDYQDDHLYYQDPLEVFDFCKRHLSPYVTLRHDYDVKDNSIPFEFTVYVLKK